MLTIDIAADEGGGEAADGRGGVAKMLRFDGPVGELDDGGVSTASTIDIAGGCRQRRWSGQDAEIPWTSG